MFCFFGARATLPDSSPLVSSRSKYSTFACACEGKICVFLSFFFATRLHGQNPHFQGFCLPPPAILILRFCFLQVIRCAAESHVSSPDLSLLEGKQRDKTRPKQKAAWFCNSNSKNISKAEEQILRGIYMAHYSLTYDLLNHQSVEDNTRWSRVSVVETWKCSLDGCKVCVTSMFENCICISCLLANQASCCMIWALRSKLFTTTPTARRERLPDFCATVTDFEAPSCTTVWAHTILNSSQKMWKRTWFRNWGWSKSLFL